MTDRTVYVLGAGFSKTFGLPLANEFLQMLVKEHDNENFIHRINTVCRNFYPNFRTGLENYPNIEDFYNYHRSLANYYSLLGVPLFNYIKDFAPEFNIEIARYLENKIKVITPTQEYYIHKFIELLKPNDAIITFNWDNIIEKYLEIHKRNYTFTFNITSKSDDIIILKLHGSIDWFAAQKNKPLNDESLCKEIIQYDDGKKTNRLMKCLDAEPSKLIKENGSMPFIVPPILYKDEMFKPIASLWGNAYSLLRNSMRKFFIGYSLPKEDTLARVLLSSYPFYAKMERDDRLENSEKIIVLNPDENMEIHYKKHCSEKFMFFNTSFEKHINTLIEKHSLQEKLMPYRNELLNCESDKFVQSVAEMVFSADLNTIDLLEKKRLKEYLENIGIKVDI